MMANWYENIEEPVRELVRLLRDGGINTTCSCGHDMYVQADVLPDASLKIIHDTVFNWMHEGNEGHGGYTIDVHLAVTRGIVVQSFATIQIQKMP